MKIKIEVEPIFNNGSHCRTFSLRITYTSPTANKKDIIVLPILNSITRNMKRLDFYTFVNNFLSDFENNVRKVCDEKLKDLILQQEQSYYTNTLIKEIENKMKHLKVQFEFDMGDDKNGY